MISKQKTKQIGQNAPCILPEPFTAAALFMNGTTEPIPEIEAMLDRFSVPIRRRTGLWITMIFDKEFSYHAIAKAAYGQDHDHVVREAFYLHPLYLPNDLLRYFDTIGGSLFGGLPVFARNAEPSQSHG